jgi:hypothetical protein
VTAVTDPAAKADQPDQPANNPLADLSGTEAALRAYVDGLSAELITERTAAQRLRDDLSAARVRADQTERKLQALQERFKETVRVTASTYARQHDWCDVVNEALDVLGLPGVDREWEVTFTVTGIIRHTLSAADEQAAVADAAAEVGISTGDYHTINGEEIYIENVDTEARQLG